jgi:hypothetical protein
MGWVLFLVLQIAIIGAGIRQDRRAGVWSGSKFLFALGFAALEAVILCGPILYFDMKGPYFWPVFVAAGVVSALNFVWMIVVARRWRLPDGRSSIEAYRDDHRK